MFHFIANYYRCCFYYVAYMTCDYSRTMPCAEFKTTDYSVCINQGCHPQAFTQYDMI